MFYNYTVSYHPGMFGEFLCTQINKDPKYWPAHHISHVYKDVNRWYHYSIIQTDYQLWPDELGTFSDKLYTIHNCIPDITQEYRDKIDRELDGRHSLLRAHYIYKDLNWLPRMKKVRFYVDEEDYLLVLLLEVIKALQLSHLAPDIQNSWVRRQLEERTQFPHLMDQVIEKLQYLTYYEFLMLTIGTDSLRDYTKFNVDLWKRKCVKLEGFDDWHHINPLDFILNPNKHMDEWMELFDLDESLDPNILYVYHQKNLNLIKQYFGYEYEELKSQNIEELLFNFLQPKMLFFKS